MTALVYLSPVPWASVAQRPHKFAEWFHATHGGPVLWLDPYPSRLPKWSDLRRLRSSAREPGPDVPPWLRLVRVPALPVEPLPGFSAANGVIWRPVLAQVREHLASSPGCELVIAKPSRLAVVLLQSLRPAHAVYDGMDDFPAFHGGLAGRSMGAAERRIVGMVDTIYASAGPLQQKFTMLGRTSTLVHNACDPSSLPELAEVAGLREPDLVGYVGTLASWFDWELVARLARARPDLRFRLIGPRHVDPPADLPVNVELRPPCPHQLAMREMARFAVGLIPFVRNPLTAAVDPVKYYEYRALGVPVLSSAFGEMPHHAAKDPGVHLLQPEFAAGSALDAALSRKDSPAQVEAFREENSWAARFSLAQDARDSLNSRL